MPSLTARPAGFWDDVDYGILRAALSPSTCRQIADTAELPSDLVKNQIEVHVHNGLLAGTVDGGVRYRLTVAGWKRLFDLADIQPLPSRQAAA